MNYTDTSIKQLTLNRLTSEQFEQLKDDHLLKENELYLIKDGMDKYATKDWVEERIVGVYRFKGSVDYYSDLPTSGQVVGDTYNIRNADPEHQIEAGDNVAWDGEVWDDIGGIVDLSAYITTEEAEALVKDKFDEGNFLIGDNLKLVKTTTQEGDNRWTISVNGVPPGTYTKRNVTAGRGIGITETQDETAENGERYTIESLIADDLITFDGDKALSARQGYLLDGKKFDPENLTSGHDIEIVLKNVQLVIDENTIGLWHFNDSLKDLITQEKLSSTTCRINGGAKFGTGCLTGARSNSLVTVTNSTTLSFGSSFTIDFWMKSAEYNFQGESGTGIKIGSTGTYSFQLLSINNNDIRWVGIEDIEQDPSTLWNKFVAKYELNKWNHLAVQKNGNTFTFFVNGEAIDSVTQPRSLNGVCTLTASNLYTDESTIGIDEVRFSNVKRYDNDFDVPSMAYAYNNSIYEINYTGFISNRTLTIKKNNVAMGTFTANSASDVDINIPVPTTVAELTDAGDYERRDQLHPVAESGDYNDLENKPAINDATLTIQKNSSEIGTFTANSNTNTTINVEVPTKVSQLQNDSNYQTGTQVSDSITAALVPVNNRLDALESDVNEIKRIMLYWVRINNELSSGSENSGSGEGQ